jgi:prepilin-type N-terminal cleavage/methylation domain-containing protein
MNRESRGFTLIELLVVIAIIGILSSVVLASLGGARSKSRDARRLSDMKQFQLALELYYDTNREYPINLSDVAPTYIPVVPTDPAGQAYLYDALQSNGSSCDQASQTCTSYVIGAPNYEGVVPPDPDNTIGSVACADPTYCVRP